MAGDECRRAWEDASHHEKASSIDRHSPLCACEAHSLRGANLAPIGDQEFVARIITNPNGVDLNTNQILTTKLTSVATSGVSLVRQGASDAEIEQTVNELIGSIEGATLLGAAVFPAQVVRQIGSPERWFCLYDTDDRGKSHHADIVSTEIHAANPSQTEKAKKNRRKELAARMTEYFYSAENLEELKSVLRRVNIEAAAVEP